MGKVGSEDKDFPWEDDENAIELEGGMIDLGGLWAFELKILCCALYWLSSRSITCDNFKIYVFRFQKSYYIDKNDLSQLLEKTYKTINVIIIHNVNKLFIINIF